MLGANTRSVLAGFGDNNWEKGEDFVKKFYFKKLVWEMEGSLSARAMTCKTVRSCCEKRIETKLCKSRKNFPTVGKVFGHKSCQVVEKNLWTSFCVCLVS